MIEIVLPFPPTVNHYYQNNYNGSKRISKQGKAFRRLVSDHVMAHRAAKLFDVPIKITLDVHYPDNRRRDLDNLNKSLLDALQKAGVYTDDSLIEELHMIKRPNITGGKVVAQIEPL